MATMNRPIILHLTVIQIWNKNLKFQPHKVVYLCLRNIYTKLQVDTSFLSWVLFNNLTSICSIWQRPWNHSTNIFIRIFLLHRIHCLWVLTFCLNSLLVKLLHFLWVYFLHKVQISFLWLLLTCLWQVEHAHNILTPTYTH